MAYAYGYDIHYYSSENYGNLNYPEVPWEALQRSSRTRGRGRSRGGRYHCKDRRRGKNRHSNNNRVEPPLHSDLIETHKVFIGNLDRSVTEDDIKELLSRFANVEEVKIVRRYGYNSTVFGFAKFASEKDTKTVLNLHKNDLKLHGTSRYMIIRPAKKEFKLPGATGFVRPVIDDRDYELEPPNPNKPTAHMLIDDVLLKIFDYLPLKNLISVERVCRRWQNLVYSNFRKRANSDIETDILQFLAKNNLPGKLTVFSKVLLLSGENIKKLSLDSYYFHDSFKLIRITAQLCPSLESLVLKNMHQLDTSSSHLFSELVSSCKNLAEFRITSESLFCDISFKILMEGASNLTTLQLNQARIRGEYMKMLPVTLKELHLHQCRNLLPDALNTLHECTNLEVLILEKIIVPGSVITAVGKSCTKLQVLVADVSTDFDKVDLSYFKSLKKLHFYSVNYSVNKLIKDLPQLEELKIHGSIAEREADFVDFSLLENLKFLILPSMLKESFGQASLQTIALCKNLEKLHLSFHTNVKEVVLSCIKKCPKLKEVECFRISLASTDIPSFVEANKRKTHRTKLVIGFDRSALDEIEKLAEAKYDIEIFDTYNLFSDVDDYSYDFDLDDDDALHYYDSDGDSVYSDDLDIEDIMENYATMREFLPPIDMYLLHNGFGTDVDSDLEEYLNM